jgi:hypothetical protein
MSDHVPGSDRPVYIGAYNPMDRDRYVIITGPDGQPVRSVCSSRQQLETFVAEHRPGTDLDDPKQVYWVDHPGQWSGI